LKVRHAEEAGAIAVIIVDTVGDAPVSPGGDDSGIPVVAVGRSDGRRLQAAACDQQVVRLAQGRFEVSAHWNTAAASGEAQGGLLSQSAAYFTFFSPENVELIVKVLDACSLGESGKVWVFAAGLTDVGVELVVSDRVGERAWTYRHAAGSPFPPVQDTSAFPCP
jgi:hypothetical protein